jgi:hypothetical protein
MVFLTAAQRPSALAQTSPGIWEVSGLPGSKTPARECFGDVASLAQFEHRRQSCSQRIISDSPGSTVVEYSCGGAGFGHSKVDVITPRSLHIETQGVSGNVPFNYNLEARRVGDCPTNTLSPRH